MQFPQSQVLSGGGAANNRSVTTAGQSVFPAVTQTQQVQHRKRKEWPASRAPAHPLPQHGFARKKREKCRLKLFEVFSVICAYALK